MLQNFSVVDIARTALLLMIGGFGLFLLLGSFMLCSEGDAKGAWLSGLIGLGLTAFAYRVFKRKKSNTRMWERQAQAVESQRIQNAIGEITARVNSLVQRGDSGASIATEILSSAQDAQVPSQEFRDAIAAVWRGAAADSFPYLGSHPQLAETIIQVRETLDLQPNEMQILANYPAMSKLIVDVYRGTAQEFPGARSQAYFNIPPEEELLWLEEASYYSYIIDTIMVGKIEGWGDFSSGGYFSGNSHHQAINTEHLTHLADGVVGITNRSVYFRDFQNRHTFRFSYRQIVSSDFGPQGFQIFPDLENALPRVFLNCYGPFLYHLMRAIQESPSEVEKRD